MEGGFAGHPSDELDTVVELILATLFMCLGVFFIYRMVLKLESRTDIYVKTDKVEVRDLVKADDTDDDTFTFTKWQAYMFAKAVDQYDYEPLSWAKDSTTVETAEAQSGDYVRIDPLSSLSDFYIQRNKLSDAIGTQIQNNSNTAYRLTYTIDHVKNQANNGANYFGYYMRDRANVDADHIYYYSWVLEGCNP